jgi:hypothetical protein
VSSSGLIYAVIVGAWAAYLVPMWLRRQDELNEARPTERFSTAIRLLSGRAAMERKASRGLDDSGAESPSAVLEQAHPAGVDPSDADPSDADHTGAGSERAGSASQRQQQRAEHPHHPEQPHRPEQPQPRSRTAPAPSAPVRTPSAVRASPPAHAPVREPGRERASSAGAPRPAAGRPTPPPSPAQGRPPAPAPAAAPASSGNAAASSATQGRGNAGRRPDPRGRATLLARRRRMVILLFAAFTLGMVAASVGGVALLWLPAIPAVLFSVYIAHLRRQEHRRFEVKLDRRRAAEAAQQLRERERERRRAAAAPATAALPAPGPAAPGPSPRPRDAAHPAGRTAEGSGVHHVQALVEAADSDDTDDSDEADGWSSGPRERPTDGESWEPVPVPLPTYVTAPVAPRSAGGGLDLNAPDTWSAGRSTAPPPPAAAQPPAAAPKRRPATPLFDQYADDAPHPRAANE